MSEIKACPFCGFDTICEENHLVFCLNCGTSNHISEWNTRPIEDALQARIAELEAENERLQNKLIIVHEKAMEDTSAALFWYAKAKGISLEHTSIENNTIAWMQKRIAELEARIKELYADNEALREHYPHFLSSEQEANYVDGVLKREWNTPEEDEAWEGLLDESSGVINSSGNSSIEDAVEKETKE